MPPIPLYNHNSTIGTNWENGSDLSFAAWQFASEEHREEYRNSGQSEHRSGFLEHDRFEKLFEALGNGELLALGIASADENLAIQLIPENLFRSSQFKLDREKFSISALGRTFGDVMICRAPDDFQKEANSSKSTGRPSDLKFVQAAWHALKDEMPSFFELSKTRQNLEIQEKVAALFPERCPSQTRIGESTIRRHRRNNPELFE